MTANTSETEITTQVFLKVSQYGDRPTLVVKAKTAGKIRALGYNRAAGLRAAAEVEFALADRGTQDWLVIAPVSVEEKSFRDGIVTTFDIRLAGFGGADVALAMKTLQAVAAKLNGSAIE